MPAAYFISAHANKIGVNVNCEKYLQGSSPSSSSFTSSSFEIWFEISFHVNKSGLIHIERENEYLWKIGNFYFESTLTSLHR